MSDSVVDANKVEIRGTNLANRQAERDRRSLSLSKYEVASI